MIRTKTNYCMMIIILLIAACGGGGGDNDTSAEFLGSTDFVFNTIIDSTTLIQEDSFTIRESFFVPRNEAYVIQSDGDLDTFNQTLTANEQISLADLDTYTYFFLTDPGCPDFFDYSNHSYNSDMLTITLDHFHQPNVGCADVLEELFVVFKAIKTS